MHNFKYKHLLRAIILIILLLLINEVLYLALYPNTFARVVMHRIENTKFEDLYVGTSKGKAGINPEKSSAKPAVNACFGSTFPKDNLYIIKDAVKNSGIKRVIYELDPTYFTVDMRAGLNDPFIYDAMSPSFLKYQYFFDKFGDVDCRAFFFPWLFYRKDYKNAVGTFKSKLKEEYRNYLASMLSDDTQEVYESGFLYKKKLEPNKGIAPSNFMWLEEKIYPDRLEDFREIIKYCKDEKLELDIIMLPSSKNLIEKNAEMFKNSCDYFEKLCKKENVKFLDFNKVPEKDILQNNENFWDEEGHMYGEAANLFSKILGKYLKNTDKWNQ